MDDSDTYTIILLVQRFAARGSFVGAVDKSRPDKSRPRGRVIMLRTIRRACVTSYAVLVVGVVSVLPVQAAEETIKIGLTVSLTTDFALAGIQEKAGVEKALEEINAAGGIPGKGGNRKIELVLADNAASPSTAVIPLTRVLASEPVAVILNIRGTQVLPQMPLISRAGIPAVTITGTRKVTQ